MRTPTPRRRDEQGAVVLLVVTMSMIIFGIATGIDDRIQD